jgi:sulfatase maturation enzyme AslB (radical SAM superfamily)
MVKKKQENDYSIKICVQSILGGWNIKSLLDHISFFKGLGIDGLMFQPLQYPFGLQIPVNWYKNFKEFPKSENDVKTAVNYLLKEKQNNGFIMNSKEEIELWQHYFNDPEYISNDIKPCKSFEQNLIVDASGNVKFCFIKVLEPPDVIGNVLNTSLEELMNGENALRIKKKMRSCNRACGIMACHIDHDLRNE